MRKLTVGGIKNKQYINMNFPQRRRATELTISTQSDTDRQLSDARRRRQNNPFRKNVKFIFLRKETHHPSPHLQIHASGKILIFLAKLEVAFSIMI